MKLNPVLEQFRGKIGDLVFRRYGEEVIVCRKPDAEGKELTPGQATARERFKLAAVYGRTALADPESKTLYESKAKKSGHPVFSVTIADFYNAPVIAEIDLSMNSCVMSPAFETNVVSITGIPLALISCK